MSKDRELSGRVAIVTGAGRNIGRAIALALAEGGAAVVVNGRSDRASVDAVAAEIASKGGESLAVMADVSDEAAAGHLIAAGVERFGRIDILVNNAATRPEKPLAAMSFFVSLDLVSSFAACSSFLVAESVSLGVFVVSATAALWSCLSFSQIAR